MTITSDRTCSTAFKISEKKRLFNVQETVWSHLKFICVSLGPVQSLAHTRHSIMICKGRKKGEGGMESDEREKRSERLGKEGEEGRTRGEE